jgi:hypothetical protein
VGAHLEDPPLALLQAQLVVGVQHLCHAGSQQEVDHRPAAIDPVVEVAQPQGEVG